MNPVHVRQVPQPIITSTVRQLTKKSVFIVVVVALATSSGCATMEESGLGDGMRAIGTSIRSGVQRLKTKGPSSSSKNNNNAALIAAKFAPTEVPNTLMKKPVAAGRLTSRYGYRLNPKGVPYPKKHKGIDYATDTGTSIYAAGDGVIDKLYVSKSYGNYIRIKHDNGFSTAYAHMHAFGDGLKKGSVVSKGQVIGAVGTTGRSSGAHLHYELIYHGKFIDPLFVTAPPEVMADSGPQTETTE